MANEKATNPPRGECTQSAVLTHGQDQPGPALEDIGNIVHLRPPT